VAQPHSDAEGPIAEAEQRAAQIRSDEHPLGPPGRRFDRRAIFYLGLMASAGVAVTYGAVRVLGLASSALVLIGVAFFVALGLEPAVSRLVHRKLPRWAAVTLVVLVVFTIVAGSVAAAIPPLVQQAVQFIERVPHYIQVAQDHSSMIGRLNERFHLQQRITDTIHGLGGSAFTGFVKAGTALFSAVSNLVIVAVLTVYFLVDMPRIRATLYRFVPHSRRPRAILIGDEIFAKVGDYAGFRRC
jgi:predicted PurR-regulated permease PerM